MAVQWKARVFDSRQGLEIFLASENVQGDCGVHSSSYSMDSSVLSLEVKRLGREAAKSPPSAGELSMGGVICLLPLYDLMACTGNTVLHYTARQLSIMCFTYYSRTSLIRTLVIRISDYPDRLGPSGKSVQNSTKLTCLETAGYRISTVQCYGL